MVCEKCWAAAYTRSLANGLPQYENYLAVLAETDGSDCFPAADADASGAGSPATTGGTPDAE